MKIPVLFLLLTLLPITALSAETAPAEPDEPFPTGRRQTERTPTYAEDDQAGAQQNFGVQPVHDNEVFAVFQGDRFEYQTKEGKDTVLWDVLSWVGSDYNKLYFESEGTWLIDEEQVEEAEVELLYGRNIATFWDLQAGIRHDFEPEPTRTFAALGVQGLAPYWFEVDMTAYISDDGDVSAALEVEYDLLLSQRLILQPRFETGVAVQEVAENGVGQGINNITLGLRLRYELRRKIAPYIGVSWNRKLGETEDLAEAEGENTDIVSFVTGIKFWF